MTIYTFIFAAVFLASSPEEIEFKIVDTDVCTFKLCKIELPPLLQEGIIFGIDCIQRTYSDTFGFTFPGNFKVVVVLFQDQKDFLAYQQKKLGKIISKGGYYCPRDLEAVTWSKNNVRGMIPTLFHEANHMIMRDRIPGAPNWISEGLSVYFGSLNLFDGQRCICIDERHFSWCRRQLKNGTMMELSEFVSMDSETWHSFNEKNKGHGYSVGYALIYFLMTNAETKTILKNILWDYKTQKRKADSVKIINAHYPGGITKLQRHWRNWIPNAPHKRPLEALIKKTKERQEQQKADEGA